MDGSTIAVARIVSCSDHDARVARGAPSASDHPLFVERRSTHRRMLNSRDSCGSPNKEDVMKTVVIQTFTLLLACAGIANAQPPEFPFTNGSTLDTLDTIAPVGERACAGVRGAARGLCFAYCEALDCDGGSHHGSQIACNRVRAQYQRVTGGPPPCDCPCVGRVDNFLEALNGGLGLVDCGVRSIPGVDEFAALQTASTDPALQFVGAEAAYFMDLAACGFPAGEFVLITLPQAESCVALVRQRAAAAGLTCTEFP
jgi:hypothetical protein